MNFYTFPIAKNKPLVWPERILNALSEASGYSVKQLTKDNHKRKTYELKRYRSIGMWLMRRLTDLSCKQVGSYFECSDNLVSHSLSSIKRQQKLYLSTRMEIRAVEEALIPLPVNNAA